MADTKISDMAVTTDVLNGDVFPMVSGGTNYQVTKSAILKGDVTELIELVASPGNIVMMRNDAGGAVVMILGTGDIIIASLGQAVNVQYDPVTLTDWNGTHPVKLGDAIDRCAALLKTLNGGVGP